MPDVRCVNGPFAGRSFAHDMALAPGDWVELTQDGRTVRYVASGRNYAGETMVTTATFPDLQDLDSVERWLAQ
jgi:hypothetical protein